MEELIGPILPDHPSVKLSGLSGYRSRNDTVPPDYGIPSHVALKRLRTNRTEAISACLPLKGLSIILIRKSEYMITLEFRDSMDANSHSTFGLLFSYHVPYIVPAAQCSIIRGIRSFLCPP